MVSLVTQRKKRGQKSVDRKAWTEKRGQEARKQGQNLRGLVAYLTARLDTDFDPCTRRLLAA